MALNQGVIKLKNGYVKILTKSEVARGYLFISNDQKIAGAGVWTFYINGVLFKKTALDGSGRLVIGKNITSRMENKKLKVSAENRNIYISF